MRILVLAALASITGTTASADGGIPIACELGASAEDTYTQLLPQGEPTNFDVSFTGDAKLLSTLDLGKVRMWFRKITPVLKYFELPRKLTVEVRNDNEDNSSGPLEEVTYGSPSIAETPDPIFVHEFGHVIFGLPPNLDHVLPICSDGFQIRSVEQELSDQIHGIENAIGYAASISNCSDLSPTSATQCLKRRESEKQWAPLYDLISRLPEVDSLPYQEFFGDFLAVLVARDGTAMATALKRAFGVNDRNPQTDRDFTSSGVAFASDEQHHYFFAIRRLLWNQFVADGKSLESAQHLLDVTYRSIASEIARRMADPDHLKKMSKTEIEDGLLAEIKRRM